MSSTGSGSSWTTKQNKDFENDMYVIDMDTVNCKDNVSKEVGRETPKEVKKHYELLVENIMLLSLDKCPSRIIETNAIRECIN
ncbi:hypothetical protein L3X38_043277 [Prunus dulcis]|uniref:Uncharacterized protein n=1 Tax=Prunus dulcis TaxID=3755 RepID=A0AAD4UY97_PRUDU|nr:hypothetical protein L3X38_043277 [Prunus dulcis]